MADGIADLTYRRYEGELEAPHSRWKVIAAHGIRSAFKKKSLWVLTALSSWYYLIMAATFFALQTQVNNALQAGPGAEQAAKMANSQFDRVIWKDQFLHGFGFSNMLYMIVAIIIGSGLIANDFRSNALLVYLSKPLSKMDYFIGKWMGMFVPMLVMIGIPHALFYVYGALSFADRGFIKDSPWLGVQLLIAIPLTAAFYTSLTVGVSSMFRSGRLAAALLAGIYFISSFFKVLMSVAAGSDQIKGPARDFVDMGTYFSIEGAVRGMVKFMIDSDGSPPFLFSMQGQTVIPKPPLYYVILTLGLVIGLGAFVALRRIRAVEVVK